MNVEIMFPVSLAVMDVPPAMREAVRAKLSAWLESDEGRRDLVASPTESFLTSAASRHSVLELAALPELQQWALEAGSNVLQWFGVTGAKLAVRQSWVDVARPGMQQNEHAHEGSLLSAIYYVEAAEGCGDLVFQDPVAARRAHRAFTGTNARTMQSAQQMNHTPIEGRMLMFESWLPHSVSGNKSTTPRVSIAIDLQRTN